MGSNIVLVFRTAPTGDTTAPVISNVSYGTPLQTSATITWTTDELSDSRVEWGPTISYSGTPVTSSTLVTSHSLDLTGLSAYTVYHFRVKSKDAAGNEGSSVDYSFQTPAIVDVTAPVISAVSSTVTTTTATVIWTTDEAADSQVQYGSQTPITDGNSNATPLDANRVTSHSVTISGLVSGSQYYYRIKSRDAAGNLATSVDYSFTTESAPAVITGGDYTGVWTLLSPRDVNAFPGDEGQRVLGGGPQIRNWGAATFDTLSNVISVFGGPITGNPSDAAYQNDLWEMNLSNPLGPTWTQVLPQVHYNGVLINGVMRYGDNIEYPAGRDNHQWTYDSFNDLYWMYGGSVPGWINPPPLDNNGNAQLARAWNGGPYGKIWSWQRSLGAAGWKWYDIPLADFSFNRMDLVFAYDSVNHVIIAACGQSPAGGFASDSFVIYPDTANPIAHTITIKHLWPGSNYAGTPSRRVQIQHAWCYDSYNRKVILFSGWTFVGDPNGIFNNDTWTYQYGAPSDLYPYSGGTWTQLNPTLSPTPDRPPLAGPTVRGRMMFPMVYDTKRKLAMFYGGSSYDEATNTNTLYGDLWMLKTDHSTWVNLTQIGDVPLPLVHHLMQYDPANDCSFVCLGTDGDRVTGSIVGHTKQFNCYSLRLARKLYAPSLDDEKNTYTSWGWTWNAADLPGGSTIYTSPSPTGVDLVDLHDVSEGDDLYQNLTMYGRTNVAAYYTRAQQWASYFKTYHRSSSYYSLDKDSFPSCHLYGHGLIEWYLLYGDTAALTVATQIANDIKSAKYYIGSSWVVQNASNDILYAHSRTAGRHLMLATRLYEATHDSQWSELRDYLLNRIMTSNYWDATNGMYWMGSTFGYPTKKLQYSMGLGTLAEALWETYLQTGDTAIRTRLITMATYVRDHGFEPTYGFCDAFGLNAGAYWWYNMDSYPSGTPGSNDTLCVTDLLVFAYKLTGTTSFLTKAKQAYDRGSTAVYSSYNLKYVWNGSFWTTAQYTTASDRPYGFMNTKYDSNPMYFGPLKGPLQFARYLFENGGSPTVLS